MIIKKDNVKFREITMDAMNNFNKAFGKGYLELISEWN